MASEDIVLRIKALMDTGDVSGAVKELQGVFNRLKLTDNIKGDFDKVFKDLAKSAEAFENKAKGSFESAADVNALKKSRKEFDNLLNGMLKSLKSLSTQDMEDIFQFDLSGIKNLTQQIEQLQKKAKETAAAAIDIQKVEKTLKDLKSMTSKTGGFDLLEDLKSGDIDSAITKFEKLQETLKGFAKGSDTAQGAVNDFLSALKAGDIEKINSSLEVLTSKIGEIGKGKNGNLLFFADGLKDVAIEIQKATEETKEFKEQIKTLETEKIENIGNQSREGAAGIERMGNAVQEAKGSFKQLGDNAENAAQDTRNLNKEIGELGQRASYFLSLENSVDLFRQGVRKAIDTVKELDKAMTETAVVTDFSIGDMWDKLPQYTQMANELGVATKGVYEASTLYYQQGLETEQVMALTNETLKMARIAGLDCADATDLMTAALRGFNMEINETSAQRVNDVYSELAAITAADTNEIATAMTKTASIANNANMELETTAALLAQMIETTREPAETAGTAMKTIVARFTEMKKAVGDVVTVEGEEVNVNKVEEALRSAGVALRDVNGEFRDTDDVFLELSSKWNSLDIMTQRYIATTAAGSRQQSRFIAMMQDYDRTMQLVEAAYNSAGSSSQQFEKTQESLESKLARLKNAWDTFLMGIADDQIVKGFVDILTEILEAFNKMTEGADGLGGSILRLGTVFAGLRAAKGIVDKLIVSFVKLKNGESAVGVLQGLTQKITNFKMGKGFVLDVDLNTNKAQGKLVNLKNDLTGLGKAAGSSTGSWATGFKTMFSSLMPVLKPLLIIAAVLGTIAATCAIIYNTSPLKAAKNEADMARGAVEDYNRALEETNEEAETLNNLMNELSSRETTFDNLIVGSLEWYEAIAKSNEELIKQIELLKTMGYNIKYSYDENGLAQVDNIQDLKQAQKEVAQKQIELQKSKQIASYNSDVATLKESFAQKNADQAWNDTFKAQSGLGTGAALGSALLVAGGILSASGVGIPAGALMAVAGSALALGEAGTIIDSFLASSEASGTLTDEQKVKLEEQAKATLAGSWGIYAEDEKQKKAGQKVISNMDNVYDTFYSTEAFENKHKKYKYDLQGNPELTFSETGFEEGLDIKEDDLTTVIKDLGYTNIQGEADWDAAATALGLRWDKEVGGAEGLYTLDKDGNKQYFDVSDHGSVDTAEQWASLMADPDGGIHIGDSKDIDAGFLAYKLAEAKRGQTAVSDLSDNLTETLQKEILYGTEDWDTILKETADNVSVTEVDAAINKSINQANARKQAIYNNLIGEDDQDTEDFQEGIRDADGNAFFDTGEGKSFTKETMKKFASNIQALETDTNFVTGQAYQAFITSKMAERKEEGLSFNEQALADLENQYYDIFQELDFTDATASLEILNQKIEQGSEEAAELKENLTSKGSSLDISNQFSDLLQSGVLDEISEDIAKLSDEAGNIDVSATRELVDSNKELKNIMDEFNVSGYAMGKILTDIQNGELTLTEITSGLVEQYKLLYSAMGQAEDVLYDLRNADLGEDYTEIGRTYEERYETIKDLYSRSAWGSENFAGNIKSLIGEEEWQSYLSEADGSTKKAWEQVLADYHLNKNNGNLYGSFSALIAANENDIFENENGTITYDLSGFENYDAVLDHMVSAFGISREYAKAMLADMATYSDTLQNDLNNLNAVANANNVYNQMYHETKEEDTDGDGELEDVTYAFTNLTNAQLAATFRNTQEWADAEDKAKEEIGEDWDTKTLQEQTDAVANKFKEVQKIINQVTVKEKDDKGKETDVHYDIESIDSQGNKYYRDSKGKMQVQRTSDEQNKRWQQKEALGVRQESDKKYGEKLAEDQKVIDMAVELEDEEFQAWLDSYTGEENSYNVLLEAGFSQESLKGVEMMKNEMIAKIQGVADALEAMSITIPIRFPKGILKSVVSGENPEYDEIMLTIGGEGTTTSINSESGYTQADIDKAIADYNKFTTLQNNKTGTGYPSGNDPNNGGNNGGSKNKNDTDAKDENLQRQLAAYKRKYENGEMDFMDYAQKRRQTLEDRKEHLDEKKEEQLEENKYDKQIYDYSDELDDFVINAEEYNKLSDKEKNLVDEELQKLREINDELNEIEDELGNMSPEQMAREQEKNQSQAALDNANADLEQIEDERHDLSISQEIAGKGPSELQDLFNMGFAVEGMLLEGDEIQTRLGMRNEYADLMNQEIERLSSGENPLLGEEGGSTAYYLDENGALKMNEAFAKSEEYANILADSELKQAFENETKAYEDYYQKNRENERELSGGKLQKNLIKASKATSDFGKTLKKTNKATDAMGETIDNLDIDDRLKDPLKKLGSHFTDIIDESGMLEKKFDGLGVVSDKTIDKLGELGVNEDLQNVLKNTLGSGKGTSVGSMFGDLFSGAGDIGGMFSSLLSGDMMSMGMDFMNAGMGMADQMKQLGQQAIQYVVQFVTTVINWWINREDWLYNLLSAIEQEVHNFNRQEQVEERFRLYSDEGLDDLVSAWEAMRQSLEKQIDLNEQLIKSRQAELQFLNLTNLPFSPAFYYDYTEERVIENPWVYDIYVLLLDLGAMLPEIGQIFSSIKQLMEDNKKRMEDGVKEIEDAREEILELEKKQLELRTKYMEDEIELEELVMDSIIEKQQEEIDELSAMNDAISAGNEKLIETLNSNLDRIRQQRENEKTEEELGEKERRLAYLRQDTSNANRKEIMDLKDDLEDERRSYTDELIDQKISALEEQNELAAEQRQKQIELLQGQLDYTEKYGLQWAEAQTLIKNGFDSEGRLRVGTDLFDMLMSKEDFTSMGLGSTRQVQQIMDWNVMSIAAAAFREINDIWDEGFGNFEMSNDVHDQSRLHLWADREVDYRQLPSWLSFLQPAYNTVQDYFWRTGNNLGTFAETAWGSGKNSTSILGKTIVPLLQDILGTVKGKYEEYNSLSVADGYVETTTGVITSTMDNVGYDWSERVIKSFGNGFAALGDSFTEGIRSIAQSNSLNNQTSTQSIGDITVQVHIDSEDTEDGYRFGENIANAFREGLSNLSIFK